MTLATETAWSLLREIDGFAGRLNTYSVQLSYAGGILKTASEMVKKVSEENEDLRSKNKQLLALLADKKKRDRKKPKR